MEPRALLPQPLQSPLVAGTLGRFLQLDRVAEIRNRAAAQSRPGLPDFYDSCLRELQIDWHATEEEFRRIPRAGPLVIVVNHPHGIADGLIIGSLLTRIRTDVRFMANALLMELAPPGQEVIPVNPFEEQSPTTENLAPLRETVKWLKAGGAVVVFPAGEVAALHFTRRAIIEPKWKDTAARLALKTSAPVVPIRIEGANGPIFHLAGLVHPRLRTALLPRELLNKRGCRIQVHIGSPIAPKRLKECTDHGGSATEYLQWRVECLGGEAKKPNNRALLPLRPKTPVAAAGDARALAAAIAALPESSRIVTHGPWTVFRACGRDIPLIMAEIGRLREIAFRAEGEGSGKARDLDRFDTHYQQLFLWNSELGKIAGAYRYVFTADVLPKMGTSGLYTSTLFQLAPQFFQTLGPALELGRSFVCPEHQKDFAPLLLLWKAIGSVASSRADLRVLFGAVSISAAYRMTSRALIADYLRRNHWSPKLASLVKARRPWKEAAASSGAPSCVPVHSERNLADALRELEPDEKGVPVLLRHYLNLGAKALGMHRDAAFSDVLDVLVAVELSAVPEKSRARFFGHAPPQTGVHSRS